MSWFKAQAQGEKIRNIRKSIVTFVPFTQKVSIPYQPLSDNVLVLKIWYVHSDGTYVLSKIRFLKSTEQQVPSM